MTLSFVLLTALIFIAAYLLGAIPFGPIMAYFHGVDLAKVGSGSTGTTNVIRAMGFWPGIVVLLCDIGKGVLATYLAVFYLHVPLLVVLSGIIAMIGHGHSVFIGFKGGKSAATGVGVLLVMSWHTFLIVLVIVVVLLVLTRYQSVATLVASAVAPVIMYYFQADNAYVVMTAVGTLFVWYKHIANIQRLISGTENKIGRSSKKAK